MIGKNKGVGWSSCAQSNFNFLIHAQVDQATFIVNLTKIIYVVKYINEHIIGSP